MFGKGVYFADVSHWFHYDTMLVADFYQFPDDVEGMFAVRP
jgi:hypothetical protein